MSAFKDNLEEQRVRRKYQKEHFWAIFMLSGVIGLFFLGFLGFSEQHWITYFFYVPNTGTTSTYYIIAFLFLISYRWWWFGLPAYLTWTIETVGKGFSRVDKLIHTPASVKKVFSFFLPSKDKYERLKKGKKELLDEFFYPKVKISDELDRADRLFYLYTQRHQIGNLFDFTALGEKDENSPVRYDENGTKRIIGLFRDKERERLEKRSKSSDKKVAERAKMVLENRKNRYEGNVTNEQEMIYRDFFQVIEGTMNSYKGETDKIHKAKIPSPLKLKTKNGKIVGAWVDDSIDVFKDGKVYFSLDMIMDTVKNMTALYISFLETQTSRQSRFVRGDVGDILSKKDGLTRFEDFFKFMFLRRLLMNYGSIPSGWVCVRVEDYDFRAIVSAIDRPLIPTITSINDGSNKSFNSDVVASAFLFTYWAFFREKYISDLMDDIDWCFNATKDYNEIKARELSSKADVEGII